MPRHPHQPTKTTREVVKLHTMVGTDQRVIADILDIDPKTLRKHYREELDQSKARANAQIGGALFKKASAGDTTAMIFWMKTQARWCERQEIDHTTGGEKLSQGLDTSKLSTAALKELMAARASAESDK